MNIDFSSLSGSQIKTLVGKMDTTELQSYIDKIQEIKNADYGEFSVFEDTAYLDYANALEGVSDSQAALLLSTQGVTTAQIQQTLATRNLSTETQYQAMQEAGLLARKQQLNNVELQSILTSQLGSEARSKAIMTSMGLSVAIEGEEAQTVKLTAKKLQQAVADGMLTKEEAQLLAMTTGVTIAQKTQIGSVMPKWIANMKAMALATWDQVKATAAWLATNPVGWLVSAGIAIVSITSVIKKKNQEAEKQLQEMASKAEEAKSNIESLTSSIRDNAKTVNDIKDRYAELSQGVDNLSNKNISLSTSEYEEFLDLTNQLSEVFPQLNRGIDDNGNVILNLNGDVNTITSSLESMLQVEKELANQKITENASEYIKNTLPQLEKSYEDLEEQKSQFERDKARYNPYTDINSIGYNVPSNSNENIKVDKSFSSQAANSIISILKEMGIDKQWETVYSNDKYRNIIGYKIEFTDEDKKAIETFYAKFITTTETEIKKSEAELARANQQLSAMASYWYTSELSLKDQSGKAIYDNLQSADLQNGIQQMLNDINWAELSITEKLDSEQKVYDYITNNILIPLENVSPEIRESVYNNIIKAFTDTTLSSNEKLELLRNLQQQLSDLGITVDLSFKIKELESDNDIIKNQLGYNRNASSAYDAKRNREIDAFVGSLEDEPKTLWLNAEIPDWVKKGTREDWKNFLKELQQEAQKTELSPFDQLLSSPALSETRDKLIELSQLGIISEDNISGLEGYNELLAECGGKVDDLIKKIEEYASKSGTAFSTINNLDTIKGGLDNLSKTYTDKMDGDSFVQSDLLSGLYEQFGDLSYFDEFINKMMDVNATVEESQEAFDKLATQYIDTKHNIANLTSENEKYVVEDLKKLGVTNAEEAVHQRLMAVEEQRKNILSQLSSNEQSAALAKKYNIQTSNDLANATDSELIALAEEIESAGLSASAIRALALQKKGVNAVTIDTTTDVAQLLEMAQAAGLSSSSLSILEEVKKGHIGSASAVNDIISQTKEQIKNALSDFTIDYNYKFAGGGSSKGSGSGGSKTESSKTEIDWIQRKLERLQKIIDATKAKFENLFTVKSKSSNLDKQIKQTTNLLKANEKAAKGYKSYADKYAKKSGLEDSLIKKIQSGDYSITDYDSDTANKINKYKEYWDNYKEARQNVDELTTSIRKLKEEQYQLYVDDAESNINKLNAKKDIAIGYKDQNKYLDKQNKYLKQSYDYQIKIAELTKDEVKKSQLQAEYQQKLRDLEKEKYENIENDYSNRIMLLDESQKKIEDRISLLEAKGMTVNAKYYEGEIEYQKAIKAERESEYKALKDELANMEKSGMKGTSTWYDSVEALSKVESEITACDTAIANMNNSITEVSETIINKVLEGVKSVSEEMDFMAGLMSKMDMFSEKTGAFTNEGLATLGSYIGGANTSQYKQTYVDGVVKAFEQAKKDGKLEFTYDGQLFTFNSDEQRNNAQLEWIQTYKDAVQDVYDYENKAIDMMIEKYQAELSALKEIIDAKKSSLDAEKDWENILVFS